MNIDHKLKSLSIHGGCPEHLKKATEIVDEDSNMITIGYSCGCLWKFSKLYDYRIKVES